MELQSDFEADVHAINAIPVVSTILEVICRTTGMRFAAIARVTEDRWVCCAARDEIDLGIEPGGALDIETTFRHTTRQSMQPIVIANIAEDRAYAEHSIPAMYGFQSYISFPIFTKKGDFFGTLCAIDTKPAPLKNPETISMFNLFGDLIAFHLSVVDELAQSETNLVEEKNTAELREQFIAILGHDLRNPLGAVLGISQLLLSMPLDEQLKSLATILLNSSYRMKELIENILDFANGRLGDGIILNCCDNADLKSILQQVIDELLLIWPNREINAEFSISGTIYCDGQRIAQVFSNLLGNALRHGKPGPIVIEASNVNENFTLSISNPGEILGAAKERLFQPFYRGEIEPHKEGLGLGLYIASEIAKAHNGTLGVKSTQVETTFTLHLP